MKEKKKKEIEEGRAVHENIERNNGVGNEKEMKEKKNVLDVRIIEACLR